MAWARAGASAAVAAGVEGVELGVGPGGFESRARGWVSIRIGWLPNCRAGQSDAREGDRQAQCNAGVSETPQVERATWGHGASFSGNSQRFVHGVNEDKLFLLQDRTRRMTGRLSA